MAEVKSLTKVKTVVEAANAVVAEVNTVLAEVEGENDEIEVFGHSCTKARKFTIIQRVENFSLHLDHNVYVSPTYYDKSARCKWSLVVTRNKDGNIRIALQHDEHKGKHLSVIVHLTIIDSFGWSSFYAHKKIDYQLLFPYEIVLEVPAKQLMYGYCGLNRIRFLPNDTLTLKCEITTYKTYEKISVNDENCDDEVEIPEISVKKVVFIWMLTLFLKFFIAAVFLCSVVYISLCSSATLYVESVLVKPLIESTFVKTVFEKIFERFFMRRIPTEPFLETVLNTTFVENVRALPLVNSVLQVFAPLPFLAPTFSYLASGIIVCFLLYILFRLLRKVTVYLWKMIKPGGDRTYRYSPEK